MQSANEKDRVTELLETGATLETGYDTARAKLTAILETQMGGQTDQAKNMLAAALELASNSEINAFVSWWESLNEATTSISDYDLTVGASPVDHFPTFAGYQWDNFVSPDELPDNWLVVDTTHEVVSSFNTDRNEWELLSWSQWLRELPREDFTKAEFFAEIEAKMEQQNFKFTIN